MTRSCLICNNPFNVLPCADKYKRGKYCSLKCCGIAKRGRRPVYRDEDAWRRNIGVAMKKRMMTEEHKRKIGEAHRGMKHPWNVARNKAMSGPNSPNWKGGISPLNAKTRITEEFQQWRKHVFDRDAYTCGFCGKTGGSLHADHIRPMSLYPEIKHDLSNGQTLCKPCHAFKTRLDRIWYDNYRTRL